MIFPRRPGAYSLPLIGIIFFLLLISAHAQSKVGYEISFPNAAHHEAEISVTFSRVPVNKPLEVRMSRSSPGRYVSHEFAKNVYKVRATDEKGTALTITRPNPSQWNISGHHGEVRISYTLFGDLGSGTYTGIDNTMAHLSIPATFMWARGFENAPIQVRFRRPDAKWKIATQLTPTSDPEIFTAPHMQYFMDSPTMLGDLKIREWPVQSNGKTYTMRLAVNDPGTEQEVDSFLEMVKKVVAEEIAVFGETPDYDFGTYTFISNYVPQIGGDGMEHRNSTSLTSTRSLQNGARGNLGTVSHEYFHSWNVERLRPRSLEPFNFEDANVSGELWLAEGFTQYYGGLLMQRAGFGEIPNFGRGLGFTISAVINTPGRLINGPVEMSQQAVFADGGVAAVPPTNIFNTFISYYTYGNAVALGLDLTLRTKFPGKTLDGYMRELWQSYGKYQKNYNPAKPYTIPDLKTSLGKYTGDAKFAGDFFSRYIEGHEAIDYEPLLAKAGFQLRKAKPGKVWLDTQLREQGGAIVLAGPTLWNGPLYKAGLDRGDKILSFDGQALTKPSDVQSILDKHKPGDTITVEFDQRSVKKTAQLTFTEDPQLEVVAFENIDREVTEDIKKLRVDWLGSHVGRQ